MLLCDWSADCEEPAVWIIEGHAYLCEDHHRERDRRQIERFEKQEAERA